MLTKDHARYARYALGAIRLTNGTIALVAPKRLVKTFGADPETNGAAVYALRLFGVRTVCLGLVLLIAEGPVLEDAVRYALPIHATDTMSAVVAGLTGQLPRRAAVTGAVVSAFNTALAAAARAG